MTSDESPAEAVTSRGLTAMCSPFLALIAGVAVVALLGIFADYFLLERAGKKPEPPSGFNETHKSQWKELTAGNEGGGAVIGWTERIMFFGALLSGAGAELLIGAWLAFKVASKWNAWTNVTAVPQKVDELDDLDFLIARRRWASNVLTRFLVGTEYNILAAILGVAVTRHWKQIVGC